MAGRVQCRQCSKSYLIGNSLVCFKDSREINQRVSYNRCNPEILGTACKRGSNTDERRKRR